MQYRCQGILQAGGTPVEFGVIAACDGIASGHEGMRYILPSRELIAGSIETMVKAHRLDGIVLLGSCDKIVPGLLMAAARLDIPNRSIRLEIQDEDLQERLSKWHRPARKITKGYLGIYSKLAASAAEGAILKTD